jgi:nitric oxide reductase subunit C
VSTPDGQKLFAENNCQSCHKMQGSGGTTGPDLTHEAQRHADVAWQIEHLKDPAKVSPGSTMPSFAKLKPEELQALGSYLATRM